MAKKRQLLTTKQIEVIDELHFGHISWVLQALFLAWLYYLLLRYWADMWWLRSSDTDPFKKAPISYPVGWTIVYILAVRSIGRYMSKHPPLESRVFEAMFVYNLYQIILNSWCFIAFMNETRLQGMAIWGNQHDKTPAGYRIGFLIWVHYNNKYVDMLDTVFILIRKKYDQMTFLHYFQRIVLIWGWFLVCRLGCGGDSYFGAMLHSGVSVFTYSYYLCAQLSIPFPWKSAVTKMHMGTCGICALHSFFVLWNGNMRPLLAVVQLATMMPMLVLFTNFQSGFDELGQHYTESQPGAAGFKRSIPRITISFDSSGWLYVYHFGVAKFVQECLVKHQDRQLAFSGSSGGALAAAALTSNVPINKVLDMIIECREACKYNPFMMLPAAEKVLHAQLPDKAHELSSGRLRILNTCITEKPPFITAQVISDFTSREDLLSTLRASCHVPLIGGVWPYKTQRGWMYDGMFWSSALLIPWRTFRADDELVKVSPFGVPGSDICPPCIIPPWWALFPPDEKLLQGMHDLGYRDACLFFSRWQSDLLEDVSRTRIIEMSSQYSVEQSEHVVQFLIAVQHAWLTFAGLSFLLVLSFLYAISSLDIRDLYEYF